MFTGIIEQIGKIAAIDKISGSREFQTLHVRPRAAMDDLELGSSIAVNGVCLTVRSLKDGVFTAELSRETLDRTTLDALKEDSIVNLERPMRADSRFGGHIVQGHVDGVGRVRSFERHDDSWDLEVDFPADNARYIVEKGSIAVDGISLTVATLRGSNAFSIAIIPHTLDNTNLQAATAGDRVNLEYDVVAKYVESMLKPYAIRNN